MFGNSLLKGEIADGRARQAARLAAGRQSQNTECTNLGLELSPALPVAEEAAIWAWLI